MPITGVWWVTDRCGEVVVSVVVIQKVHVPYKCVKQVWRGARQVCEA